MQTSRGGHGCPPLLGVETREDPLGTTPGSNALRGRGRARREVRAWARGPSFSAGRRLERVVGLHQPDSSVSSSSNQTVSTARERRSGRSGMRRRGRLLAVGPELLVQLLAGANPDEIDDVPGPCSFPGELDHVVRKVMILTACLCRERRRRRSDRSRPPGRSAGRPRGSSAEAASSPDASRSRAHRGRSVAKRGTRRFPIRRERCRSARPGNLASVPGRWAAVLTTTRRGVRLPEHVLRVHRLVGRHENEGTNAELAATSATTCVEEVVAHRFERVCLHQRDACRPRLEDDGLSKCPKTLWIFARFFTSASTGRPA